MIRTICVTTLLMALPIGFASADDTPLPELSPKVLAQVNERSGFRVLNHRGIRIFEDGKIESLEKEKWVEIGKLSAATAARLKRTTDVMSPKIKVITKDSGLADDPISTYVVRNKEGEIVLIGGKGPQDSILMQGGASSIIEVLDGFKTLSSISY
jgi:hypothetical protein